MSRPSDSHHAFIVMQVCGLDGIFGMRVSMQIMSFEFFQQKIMTQELQEPREQSCNEDFQVTKRALLFFYFSGYEMAPRK